MINYFKNKLSSFFSVTVVDAVATNSSDISLRSTYIQSRQFHKVVGLIPQSHCLFKYLEYEVSLVSRSALEQCIQNELASLVEWTHRGYYYLVYHRNDKWRIALWFWNKEEVHFSCPVTHVIPSLAYHCGIFSIRKKQGLLCYQENNNLFGCLVSRHGEIQEFYPLDTPLYERWFHSLSTQDIDIFATHDYIEFSGKLLDRYKIKAPAPGVLSAGKCAGYFDIGAPWDYKKQFASFFCASLIFIVSDLAVLHMKSNILENELVNLNSSTNDLVKVRADIVYKSSILRHLAETKRMQQTVVQLLDMLIKKLPSDVLLTDFSYEGGRAIIQGSVKDSVQLLDVLGAQPMVSQVRLLGDVTVRRDGAQVFKAEIILVK
ncbi:PilN domain-containing protein [Aeromonas dhakensis]|uniref:PilN domain-containing protein n=1 Tax=Aeromonas dhakensis TaxID=196024 RepID=UPI00208FE184|nr:PilN domain-containing protein [Aeromonas dhakensis]USP08624.1 PilN domain-containing protein [Aeromonas dhakensis]